MISKLQTRVSLIIIAAFLLASSLFVVVQAAFQRQHARMIREKVILLLQTVVSRDRERIANELFEGRTDAILLRIHQMRLIQGVQGLAIFSRDGRVVLSSGALSVTNALGPLVVSNLITRPDTAHVITSEAHTIAYTQSITAGGEALGFIRIEYSLADIESDRRMSVILLFTQLVALLLTMVLLFGFFISRSVIRPIGALRKAINQMRQGELGTTVPVPGNDELSKLTQAFNDMSVNRKRVERELQNSENRYRELVDLAVDGILLGSHEGMIIGANECMCKLTGRSRAELAGKDIRSLMFKPESLAEAPLWLDLVQKGETVVAERILIRPDGSEVTVEIRSKMMPDGTYQSIYRDITERKRVAAELHQMQKLQSIGTLAGGIAHDFNNIMMGLFGNISLAKRELSDEHPSFAPLQNAEKSMNRATRLTKQLLTFAKGGDPVKEEVGLGALVKEVAQFDLSGSNVLLVTKQADDLWTVKADKGQIQQVISNLTINARQAMANGGHLYITLENAVIKKCDVPNLHAGKFVKVTVRDEGEGIDPEIMGRIFDPYYTTKRAGSGLGLATTYSIISRHGGHIEVASEPGQGAIFTFYLPAADMLPLPPPMKSSAGRSRITSATNILIMDDDDFIRIIIPRWLEKTGCRIESAADGSKTIDLYKRSFEAGIPFDVVILDLTIPGGIGGLEVLKAILQIDPKAKAIVSSGYAEGAIMSNYDVYGFRDFIEKPYTEAQLHEVIERVLAQKP